jgi:glycine cleavage system H protein
MNFPANIKYSKKDEWALVDGDVLTLGISDFAQDALGELVHVELPEVGRTVSAGEAIVEVESVKAVADVFSPVDGEIVEVNSGLDGNEAQVNDDPYGAGWLVKIKIADAAGLSELLDAEAYKAKVSK